MSHRHHDLAQFEIIHNSHQKEAHDRSTSSPTQKFHAEDAFLVRKCRVLLLLLIFFFMITVVLFSAGHRAEISIESSRQHRQEFVDDSSSSSSLNYLVVSSTTTKNNDDDDQTTSKAPEKKNSDSPIVLSPASSLNPGMTSAPDDTSSTPSPATSSYVTCKTLLQSANAFLSDLRSRCMMQQTKQKTNDSSSSINYLKENRDKIFSSESNDDAPCLQQRNVMTSTMELSCALQKLKK